MNDKQELEKIYDDNLKIETFHELKENPPLAGSIAKKLLNNCKRALKIISRYQTVFIESELEEEINKMEDELSKLGRIRTITYNLGARTRIHVATEWIDRWEKK